MGLCAGALVPPVPCLCFRCDASALGTAELPGANSTPARCVANPKPDLREIRLRGVDPRDLGVCFVKVAIGLPSKQIALDGHFQNPLLDMQEYSLRYSYQIQLITSLIRI